LFANLGSLTCAYLLAAERAHSGTKIKNGADALRNRNFHLSARQLFLRGSKKREMGLNSKMQGSSSTEMQMSCGQMLAELAVKAAPIETNRPANHKGTKAGRVKPKKSTRLVSLE